MDHYLNHDDAWPQFRRLGLEVNEQGALTLRRLPGPPRIIARVPGDAIIEPLAAGIAARADGAIYTSDPLRNAVYRFDPIDGSSSPLLCGNVEASGFEFGSFHTPQGLAYQACYDRLLIADTGNRRIQVVDLKENRVCAVWGQTWPYDPPQPCAKFGGLDGPERLACDRQGNVFVVDISLDDVGGAQNRRARVVKFDRDGRPTEAKFDCQGTQPVQIAIGTLPQDREECCELRHEAEECVFVAAVDGNSGLVLWVFDSNGTPRFDEPIDLLPEGVVDSSRAPSTVDYQGRFSQTLQQNAALAVPQQTTITGFTVLDGMAIVALGGTPQRVWCFELTEAFTANDPTRVEPSWLPLHDGPTTALGVRIAPRATCEELELVVCEGPQRNLLALDGRGAYRTQGAFLAGPFYGRAGLQTYWHRLRWSGAMHDDERVRWFTLSQAATATRSVRPPRLEERRIPNWYRFEAHPNLFHRLKFDDATETMPLPKSDDALPLRRSGGEIERDRTPAGMWSDLPENQFDVLIPNSAGTSDEPADRLWIFGLIAGNGKTSPALTQAQLTHDDEGWMDDLPDVYRRDPVSRTFVRSLLSLFESRFQDVSQAVDRIPSLFSSGALITAYGGASEELDWLRDILALPQIRRTGTAAASAERTRAIFRDGLHWSARRGTPEGFRRLLWMATGVEVVIDEPGVDNRPETIGVPQSTTPDAEPSEATQFGIGAENIIGYSTFADTERDRPRLPDDVAHHFVVRGYECDLIDDDVRQAVVQATASLAPAHNTYSVQTIAPSAALGIQARLGIDAVVARCHPSDPPMLGRPPGPDTQFDSDPLPPRIGGGHVGGRRPPASFEPTPHRP